MESFVFILCLYRLRNDLYCVEWDVKPYYTIPYAKKLLNHFFHKIRWKGGTLATEETIRFWW